MSDYTKDAEHIVTQISECVGGGCEHCVSQVAVILRKHCERGRREENDACMKIAKRHNDNSGCRDCCDTAHIMKEIRARMEAK